MVSDEAPHSYNWGVKLAKNLYRWFEQQYKHHGNYPLYQTGYHHRHSQEVGQREIDEFHSNQFHCLRWMDPNQCLRLE